MTTAKVTVSAANQKEILKQAEADKSDEIIIKVSEKDVKDGAKLELSLDKTFIEDILNKTDADLTIQTPDGEKTFTQEELKKLADATTGSTITLDSAASTGPCEPERTDEPKHRQECETHQRRSENDHCPEVQTDEERQNPSDMDEVEGIQA